MGEAIVYSVGRSRRELFLLCLFFGFILGLILPLIIIRIWLKLPYLMEVIPAGLVATAIIGYGIFRLYDRNRWYEIKIWQDVVELTHPKRTLSIPMENILLVLGIGGIYYNIEKPMDWKRVVLATEKESFSLRLDSSTEECYFLLAKVSTKAICLPYKGNIRTPLEEISNYVAQLERTSKVLIDSSISSFVFTFAYLAAATTLSYLQFFQSHSPVEKNHAASKLILWVIVLVIGFFLSLKQSYRLISHYLTIRKFLAETKASS